MITVSNHNETAPWIAFTQNEALSEETLMGFYMEMIKDVAAYLDNHKIYRQYIANVVYETELTYIIWIKGHGIKKRKIPDFPGYGYTLSDTEALLRQICEKFYKTMNGENILFTSSSLNFETLFLTLWAYLDKDIPENIPSYPPPEMNLDELAGLQVMDYYNQLAKFKMGYYLL